ncbi:MAG: two-component system, OmpR family, sensor histidine kinase SenX3 [Actinomycetota bacterium]|nr:two-component system, OmpR family, sensor histidine kinase SenX3 [Actinomycetota bacterium]
MAVPAYVTVLAVVLAAVLGVVVGAAGVHWKAREKRATVVAAGPTVAELLARIVRRSHAGLAVINRFGDVVLSNDRAEVLGAVVGARPENRVAEAAARVSETGGSAEIDLSPSSSARRTPQSVIARLGPLGDGFVVVEASDTSAAVRLEAVRRDFVANVGHELKTPVGAMGVLAEAVLDADDPEEVTRFATKILHESRRMGALVTELIELSRLQGAEPLPALDPVDVDDVISRAVARVRVSAETAGTDLALDAPSGLEVAGSSTLLVTALANLLENAVAYSPSGSSVSVRRRRVRGADGADGIEISVTDRGIGIAPEHQERVFERFFRVDPARSRATGGTGLGLAIVKHVAANHGGDVRVWSEPGVGSTFTLRLPVPAEDPDDEGHGPTSGAPPAAPGDAAHRGAHRPAEHRTPEHRTPEHRRAATSPVGVHDRATVPAPPTTRDHAEPAAPPPRTPTSVSVGPDEPR